MTEDTDAAAFRHFITDLIVDLARRGVIPRETLERLADDIDAPDGSLEGGKAMIAASVLIESSVPATSRRQFEADFRRRQMRERTAMIARPDGGNGGD